MYDCGVLERLAEAIEELSGMDPNALGEGDQVVELHRLMARLDAVVNGAVGAFDTGGQWAVDSARSAPAWIAARCRVPVGAARRRVRLGRSLRHLGPVDSAWRKGSITQDHVSVLAAMDNHTTRAALERDQQMLVEQASVLSYNHFVRLVAYWRQRVDPDGADDHAAAQRSRRSFRLSQSFEGMWLGDVVLDPISGAIVSGALGRIEDEMFAADWAEAKARLGTDKVVAADLVRSPAQRRADALVEMAGRAGAMPKGARRPEPLFSVLVNYECFAGRICETSEGAVVSPGELTRWLEQAWVERAVFDGPSRVVDLGAATRLFTGATRRAVQLRDRQCFHPMCEEPARRCEVDHVEPWSAGGTTVQANARLACAFHNRERHRVREKPLATGAKRAST